MLSMSVTECPSYNEFRKTSLKYSLGLSGVIIVLESLDLDSIVLLPLQVFNRAILWDLSCFPWC